MATRTRRVSLLVLPLFRLMLDSSGRRGRALRGKWEGICERGRVVYGVFLSLLLVTLAMLLEFHKSLRCSRKWLPGFGMLLSGHCRHRWILCGLLHPPPTLNPPPFPFLLSCHPLLSSSPFSLFCQKSFLSPLFFTVLTPMFTCWHHLIFEAVSQWGLMINRFSFSVVCSFFFHMVFHWGPCT